jgi:hypothetical protein
MTAISALILSLSFVEFIWRKLASRGATQTGDLLFEAGEATYELFVVLEGEVQVALRPARVIAPSDVT